MSDKTYTKQELLNKMESLATISPSEKQTLRDFILKLDKKQPREEEKKNEQSGYEKLKRDIEMRGFNIGDDETVVLVIPTGELMKDIDEYAKQGILSKQVAGSINRILDEHNFKSGDVDLVYQEDALQAIDVVFQKSPVQSYREKVDKIKSILSEIIDIASGSRDYFAINSCIMTLRMPEDINNPKKLKKVADDILYKNDDTRIRKQLKELTDRLNAIADTECKPPKKSNIPKLRVYEVTEPEYELLQGFCSYMNDNCDGSYSFYLDIAVLDNHKDTKYTAVMVSDGVNKWQALTPAAYVTVLQGEEYFNLAAHDILDNPNAAVLYNRNCFSDELYDKEAEEADLEL